MIKFLLITYYLIAFTCGYIILIITPNSNWMSWLDELSTYSLILLVCIFVGISIIKYIRQKDRKILIYLAFGLLPLITLPWTEVNLKALTPAQQNEYDKTMERLIQQREEREKNNK